MAEFLAGPTMVLTWTYSGGTIALSGDYRTCTWNPSVNFEDVSAGSDTQVGRLTALKDATADIEIINQTSGTAIQTALQPGQAGTLLIQPEGTAVNKRKISFPSYSNGAVPEFPYANVSVTKCGFTAGGAVLALWTDTVN